MEADKPFSKGSGIAEHGSATSRSHSYCYIGSFTFQQLQELQHQVLIYKYMQTGLPVPLELLTPICKSFANSFHAIKGLGLVDPLSYCKENNKMEAEPGRCRRTDGKNWRCNKNVANPDQKYCQRHLHRRRGTPQSAQPNSRNLASTKSVATSNDVQSSH